MYVITANDVMQYYQVGAFTQNGYFENYRTKDANRARAVCSYLNGGEKPDFLTDEDERYAEDTSLPDPPKTAKRPLRGYV